MTRTDLVESFIRQAQENTAFARQEFSGLDDGALNWRINPDEWSIAQCIQHTTMVATHWLRQFEKISKKQLRAAASEKFTMGLLSRYLLKVITPEVKIKLKTPSTFEPHHILNGKACLKEFEEVQERMVLYSEKFADSDLASIRLHPPQFSFIQVNMGEALMLHNHHVRRHLLQAQRTKLHEMFPAG